MAYHDLGWYEFLFTLLFLCPAFLILDRKPRPTGFFPLAFILLYVPVRFFLDFLRISDARYGGLTFGQYAAIAGFAAAGYVALRRTPSGNL
jgi:phosphatidylglycerol:prolipoprotein diacylglycerol transferase